MLRIKDILKDQGKTMDDLASCIGITRESLYSRINNPKLSTLQEVANCLKVEVNELIETSDKYGHWYDKGEWLGIHKKCK